MSNIKIKTRTQLLKSPVILDFIEACLNYIRIIENEEVSEEEFLKTTHQSLCGLYAKALPFMDIRFAELREYVDLDRRLIWPEGKPNILSKLRDDKYYKEVFNPFSVDTNAL